MQAHTLDQDTKHVAQISVTTEIEVGLDNETSSCMLPWQCIARQPAHLSGLLIMSLKPLLSRKSTSRGSRSSVRASSIAMFRAALTAYVIIIWRVQG